MPVNAIFAEDEVPDEWKNFTEKELRLLSAWTGTIS